MERVANEVIAELGARSEKDDLVQSGFAGLLEAKAKFDPERGVPFSGFAYRRIRGAMIDTLRKSKRLSRSALERCRRAALIEPVLELAAEETAERPPTGDLDAAAAIAALLGKVTAAYVADVVASVERHGTEEGLVTQLDATKVRHAIDKLPERERDVIHAVYFEERRLAEIGEQRGRSESWACRVHGEALAQLREVLS